jgi:hypothetical protein
VGRGGLLFLILFPLFPGFRHSRDHPQVVREDRPAHGQFPVPEAFD